jgi:hypothetical protein
MGGVEVEAVAGILDGPDTCTCMSKGDDTIGAGLLCTAAIVDDMLGTVCGC